MRTLSILKTLSAVAAVSAIAITATSTKASAITFNLGTPPGGTTQLNPEPITQSGIQLTSIASASRRGNDAIQTVDVIRQGDGLGIVTNTTNFPSDNNQIDGRRAIETLTLAFNQFVRLTKVTFTAIGSNDSFVFINGSQVGLSQAFLNPPASGDNGTSTFTPSVINTSFGFRASQANDDFYVSSVDVEAVPEPITIAGMALGSGFGVLLRRKYKKAAKFSNKLST